MKSFTLILCAILLLSLSCDRKSDNSNAGKETKETSKEKVKRDMDLITDSLNTSWKNMVGTDDQKLADIKRLLDEISYTSDYDVVLHDSLTKQFAALKASRYDESLNLDQMDAYDQKTDDFIRKVYLLKAKSKEIEKHQLAEQLVEDINKANSVETTVSLRKRYDNWAKAYNEYLKSHRKQLEKLGEPYASLKEKSEIIK